MKLSILILILLFNSFVVSAQYFTSVSEGTGEPGNFWYERGSMVFDKEGNYYITGDFTNEITFGNITLKSKAIVTPSFSTYENSFVVKYNKEGNVLWAKSINSTDFTSARNILIDNQNNIYIIGNVKSNISVDSKSLNLSTAYFYIFSIKLTSEGSVVYTKALLEGYNVKAHISTLDLQGNLLITGSDNHSMGNKTFLIKYAPDGKNIWEKTISKNHEGFPYITDVKVNRQGNIFITGRLQGKITFNGQTLDGAGIFLSKMNPEGSPIWLKSAVLQNLDMAFEPEPCLAIDSVSNIYIKLKANEGSVISKYNKDGDNIWSKFLDLYTYNQDFAVNNSGEIYVTGVSGTRGNNLNRKFDGISLPFPGNNIIVAKLSSTGKLIWINFNQDKGRSAFTTGLKLGPAGKIGILGETQGVVAFGDKIIGEGNSNLRRVFSAVLIDSSKLVKPNKLKGFVFDDINKNKIKDLNEPGLAGYPIRVEPGPYFAISDNAGGYEVEVDTGTYIISQRIAIQKNTIIQQNTPITNAGKHLVRLKSLNKVVDNLNFGNEITKCPLLTIDIAADRRRRCFRSKTTVTYTNEGAGDATNVKIKVVYPQYVVPISSTKTWAAKQDSVLLFDIGLVKAGERKSFVITDSTICGNEGIRGLSQCVKAFITPKSTCITPNQNWNQASVAVAANLTGPYATFTIANEGEGNMTDSTAYRFYANAALIKKGKVKLAKGEKKTFDMVMVLATLRLEADQVPNHPGRSRPTVSLQPAALPQAMAAPPKPIQDSYQDDADAEVSIACLNIIDSYDPNDKQVFPHGITKRNYIKAEDELQYLIRFQNTGTDTAFTVVVRDTISQHLDISSLRVGSASHPFTYTVSGKGNPVLTFTFKKINLPDHKTNEPASHGYVKFAISQNPNNPKGTVIKNKADNYFDFNSPIATNEVFNMIGDTVMLPPEPIIVYDCGKENPTVAQAGAAINLCETSQTTLQANAPSQGTGRWKLISGQATIVNPESPASALQNIGYGETVLEWTITLCKKTSSSQVKINRYAIPAAPSIATPPLQCEGDILQPLVATGAAGSSFTWYKDAAKQQKLGIGNNYVPAVTSTTTFYASQTVNGCESPAKAVIVSIHPKQINITALADTLVAPPADSYQWYFNDKLLKSSTSQKLTVRNTGLYRVKAVTNGCTANSENKEHIITLPASAVKLGPNPVQAELVVALGANATGEVRIIVTNQLGSKVKEYNVKKTTTHLEQTLPLASLSPGMYFLEIQLGKETFKQKFIKQ